MSKQWSCASLQAGYQVVMGEESEAELARQEAVLMKQIEVSCHNTKCPYLQRKGSHVH